MSQRLEIVAVIVSVLTVAALVMVAKYRWHLL